jgi:hypothetical protein
VLFPESKHPCFTVTCDPGSENVPHNLSAVDISSLFLLFVKEVGNILYNANVFPEEVL